MLPVGKVEFLLSRKHVQGTWERIQIKVIRGIVLSQFKVECEVLELEFPEGDGLGKIVLR